MRRIEVSVFIVGAGVTGLSSAGFLAREGISVLAVSRYSRVANSPRAHITNQRAMEVLRDLGLERRVREEATPVELMSNNTWLTSFAGTEIARLQTWGTLPERKTDYELNSPGQICNMPQHMLEPILLEEARRLGAEVLFDTEMISMEQNENGVRSVVRNRTTGEELEILSKYAIGADGDNSFVCKEIGFTTRGQMGLGHAINAWIEVDLAKYCAHRPGVLYWTKQPGNNYWIGNGTYISVRPWNEWVLLFMYDPDEGELDLSDDGIIARARSTIGVDDIPVKVKSVTKWTINRVVADFMRKDRVLIAGNAAHRHPPASGLGSNTCLQDSFNLAWKLAMVVWGQAGEALLDSYNDERQPVAKSVVDRAMQSMADMGAITDALGFEPGQDEAAGWANIDELFSDSERGRERRRVLKEAVDLQNVQFNGQGIELGVFYDRGALIAEAEPRPEPRRRPDLFYTPSTYPGSPLPHAWLNRDNAQVSTLDLCGRGRFTVLTGVGGAPWKQAAAAVAARLGIDLRAVSIGGPQPYCDAHDINMRWAELRDVADDGCVLVRPDLYVAWRKKALVADPEAALEAALRQILARTEKSVAVPA
ncbi:FAD-dependent monooxygenase [Paracoccus shandongensis]|uniref:FAD-dependent monooxygenase n=1 Tax=Paracoccus shandongensis TaxID=2816048 RepID=UPI001A8F0D44|nr:FAD-dependent monooxygenase [Paracoccus shandongensis]